MINRYIWFFLSTKLRMWFSWLSFIHCYSTGCRRYFIKCHWAIRVRWFLDFYSWKYRTKITWSLSGISIFYVIFETLSTSFSKSSSASNCSLTYWTCFRTKNFNIWFFHIERIINIYSIEVRNSFFFFGKRSTWCLNRLIQKRERLKKKKNVKQNTWIFFTIKPPIYVL